MKIAALFCVAASLTLTFAPAVASAEEPSKPVSGKAPPEPPPDGDEDAKPAKDPNDKPAEPVFDMQGFQRERASDDIIAKVREKCFASPMSREGMSPAETRVCNAEVAKLERRGAAAIGSILAEINDAGDNTNYYERTRLFHVLAKTDDPKVEDVLIRGYARLATSTDDDRVSTDGQLVEGALGTMNGVDPVGAEAIGQAEITDDRETAIEHVMIWRAFQRDHEGTAKSKLRKDALARARTDKTSKDPKKAYLALSTLAELAPNEAMPVIEKFLDREDVGDDQKTPFYTLQMIVVENPIYRFPE